MNYQETLNYIHSLGNFSKPATLDRIKQILEILGNPQNDFKAIHIAGTNGKGSVSAMLASIFKESGYKTGLFISPYIIDFRERIQINGEYISEESLVSLSQRVIETKIELTEFEFITAVAFLYFKEQKIDILICETGLGGRLDATNTLENLSACVITKIGLDHTAILGESIAKIAEEKCGILRNCPTITNPSQPKEALEVIKTQAKNLYVPSEAEILKSDICGNTFIYKEKEYEISLGGEYQVKNAVTVIETVIASGYDISYTHIYNGLKNTFFPCRMEVISKNPLLVIDGAHNIDGALCLSKELEKFSGEVTALIGMMKDKDCEEVLKLTLCHCKKVIVTSLKELPRSAKADELYEKARKYCEAEICDDLISAVNKASKISGDKPLFVFGSLYLASAVRPILKEKFK